MLYRNGSKNANNPNLFCLRQLMELGLLILYKPLIELERSSNAL